MRRELVELVKRKLQVALHDVDSKSLACAREAWKDISPAPNCPAIADVMKIMHAAIANGLTERSRLCLDVVIETVSPFKKSLSKKIAEEIMEVVKQFFPKEHFQVVAHQTYEVYTRAQAPTNKLNKRIFENEHALIVLTEANISRQAMYRVRTALDELLLQERSAHPSWWKRLLSGFWKFLAFPLVKWALTLIGAVITAFVLHALGLGGV